MTTKRERRFFTLTEMRAKPAETGTTLTGHAAVFGKDSLPMYGFIERIAPGCFTQSIKEDDIRALFNHDPNYVLGRNVAETLRLSEDDSGLSFEIDAPDTQTIKDLVLAPIARGDISQCSFGFETVKDTWEYDRENDLTIRTLNIAKLYDVSPVTFPAYPDTDVSVRSLTEIAEEGKRRIAAEIVAATPKQVPLELRKRQLAALEAM